MDYYHLRLSNSIFTIHFQPITINFFENFVNNRNVTSSFFFNETPMGVVTEVYAKPVLKKASNTMK